jgi:pyruvate-formate lyase-activating enzyme
MKALIKVGYACNENCGFCHTLDVRHIDGDSSEVHRKIDRAAQLGHTMIVFSGGEATIRPELFEWAQHAVSLGLDTGLVTNGLMLAYPDFLERMLKLRLKYVYMSLHGGTAKIHNLMVRANTFEAATKALQNISGRGLDVTLNCVITAQNVEHLRSMVDLVLPYRDVTLKFSMVQPKGGGAKLFDFLMPRVSDVAARVHDAMTYGFTRAAGKGPRFTHDGIPLCLLPGFEDLYDDLKTDRFWTMVEIGEADFFPVDDKAKIQPAPCQDCALRGPCPGLYRGYEEEHGSGELRTGSRPGIADVISSSGMDHASHASAPTPATLLMSSWST